ncbi:hypothetical protein K491DRAFT_680814 [Lophiostoma macrostomum CBS 122681]|uniref:Uncharacterized protein n=1 Tax=Lophiostoma macrostomum CBS 122681 TaxID=1314788 RepID=A0A6A6SZJ7_9PLEO|nr:hypothetical protein K491DRAFT_680814 [Lophiostoma macrostomum CBS 122681]
MYGAALPPGSKYTDYYYNPATSNFVAYHWDPEGRRRQVDVPSATLNEGTSFLNCKWETPTADWGQRQPTLATCLRFNDGDFLYLWKTAHGKLNGFVVWRSDWPQPAQERQAHVQSPKNLPARTATTQYYAKNDNAAYPTSTAKTPLYSGGSPPKSD